MENPSQQIIVAIDGPSGTGKSTTAKLLAKKLNIGYLDTGAMYRALTWKALDKGIPVTDPVALKQLVGSTEIDFDSANQVRVDGVVREAEIRLPYVSKHVSLYCTLDFIRRKCTDMQRTLGKKGGWVLDGRDIGTVVFPNANFKFFLVADYRVRAQRRLKELRSKGVETDLDSVEENLRERDRLDSARELAPLKRAEDAKEIDTTFMTIDEQVQTLFDTVMKTGQKETQEN